MGGNSSKESISDIINTTTNNTVKNSLKSTVTDMCDMSSTSETNTISIKGKCDLDHVTQTNKLQSSCVISNFANSDIFNNLSAKYKSDLASKYLNKQDTSGLLSYNSSETDKMVFIKSTVNNKVDTNITTDTIQKCMLNHITQSNKIECTGGSKLSNIDQQNDAVLNCCLKNESIQKYLTEQKSNTDNKDSSSSGNEQSASLNPFAQKKAHKAHPNSQPSPSSSNIAIEIATGAGVSSSSCCFVLLCLVIIVILFMTMSSGSGSSSSSIPSNI
jgi:hypothetical protein